ncbi:hypothetical protein T07_5344 [Trichinella nelsoni]|uniref:Uncharacterized protein n=1 Tax=Trichinella nelsoni TaxID=6336 RepID=A0A0V0RD62_9BILA|nr:hypothetical protein T07_5344 [Trichinella nelsoni]
MDSNAYPRYSTKLSVSVQFSSHFTAIFHFL